MHFRIRRFRDMMGEYFLIEQKGIFWWKGVAERRTLEEAKQFIDDIRLSISNHNIVHEVMFNDKGELGSIL